MKNENRSLSARAIFANGNGEISDHHFVYPTSYKPRSTNIEFLAEVEKVALGIAAVTSDLVICAKHLSIAEACHDRIIELKNE